MIPAAILYLMAAIGLKYHFLKVGQMSWSAIVQSWKVDVFFFISTVCESCTTKEFKQRCTKEGHS